MRERGGVFSLLRAYRRSDPAAQSLVEILFLYPGIKALALHRLAHALWRWKLPFVPRLVSEISRFLTGIEIHPGARIGREVVIDHGFGVVIGETAVVGDGVLIYQGVSLGGTSLQKGKRHPTIGPRVTLGAGCKVLGNIEVGEGSRIGSNSVLVQSVPAGSTVVGVPGRLVSRPAGEAALDFTI